MMDWIRNAAPLAALVVLAAGSVAAQDDSGTGAPGAEQQAMMEAWANAGRTGEPHAQLAGQAGRWRAEMEMWMGPDAPPVETTYQVSRTMQLDGRVLHEDWTGEFMGRPYHGIGRTGYDNTTGEFWSTWTDNMSTGLMISHGKRQPDGRIEMTGDYVDPVTAETVPARFVWTFPGPDSERMEAYETRGGEEFMNMRMTLTRIDE